MMILLQMSIKQMLLEKKMVTTPENLQSVLQREFGDVSAELSSKLSNTIGQVKRNGMPNYKDFNEVILIKKKIQNHGNKRIVSINVSEKLVPKYSEYIFSRDTEKDFTLRAILVVFLFLLGGIIFTTTLKFFPKYIKEKYIEGRITGKEIKG